MKTLRFKTENAKMAPFHGHLKSAIAWGLLSFYSRSGEKTPELRRVKIKVVIKDPEQRKCKIAHPMHNLGKFFAVLT